MVWEIEKKDATSYKSYSLKRRLQNRYPSLQFVVPKNPNESDIVFAKDLTAETLYTEDRASIDEPSDTDLSTTDTDSEDDTFTISRTSGHHSSNLRDRYVSYNVTTVMF